MKPLAKSLFVAALTFVGAFTINRASAQLPQPIATWSVEGITAAQNGGGSPPANFVNNGGNVNLIITPIQKGFGFGLDSGLSKAYGGADFTNNNGTVTSEANSIASGYYITYAIQASPGYTVSFSTNVAYIHNSATGPWEGELQYSTDSVNYVDMAPVNFASGNVSTTAYQAIPMTNTFLQNVPSTTTNFFRLVIWGATGTGGVWYIDGPNSTTLTNAAPGNLVGGTTNEFVILGQVKPIPQAIATWSVDAITSAQNGGGAPPANFAANSTVTGVTTYPMQKGFGFGLDTGLSKAYGGVDFTNNNGTQTSEANSIASGYYITYAIQAATNYVISFSTNLAYLHNSATGPWAGELQYSTDAVNYTDLVPLNSASGNVSTTSYQIALLNNSFLQNVPTTTTNFFRLVIWGATGTGGVWYIDGPNSTTLTNSFPGNLVAATTNEFAVFGTVTSLTGQTAPPPANSAPTNIVASPSTQTVGVGGTATFNLTGTFGVPTGSNFWFQVVGLTTTPVAAQNSTILTLTNVLGANAGGYFAIVSNSLGTATSSVATLTVTGDPTILAGPNYTYGLIDGTVYFSVTAAGTSPSYQWYFTDPSGNVIAPVNSGSTTASGAQLYGTGSSVLSISNVQTADLTNFIVVISNLYGKQTSSVASILAITNVPFVVYPSPFYEYLPPVTPLALWDFNGSIFTNTVLNPNSLANPSPYLGVGSAGPVGSVNDPGTSPFAGSADANDGTGFDILVPSLGDHLPSQSWGSDNYPASGSNKLNGVQFTVSTVGAKNILLEYDSRVSGSASDFERVQYTTDSVNWVDYPSSSTFNGVGSSYITYTNDFSGFPGVANNANFGVRIVTETETTATYNTVTTNGVNYLGTSSQYTTSGTVTYDLVGIYGTAITNNNVPPVISPLTNAATLLIVTNETTPDNLAVTNTFYVSGDATADKFNYTAAVLNLASQPAINPTITFTSNSLGYCTMIIKPNSLQVPVAAAPIVVTVTDTKGDTVKSWFNFMITSAYQPPTNTLTQFTGTNILANSSVTVPFMVGSQSNLISALTYQTNSQNNTVLPATNITILGQGTANPSAVFAAGSNVLGVALVSVTVNDNNPLDPKSSTATIPIMVRPNTNVVFVDYFNYDSSGPLDEVGGFWSHLSGTFHFMQENSSPTGGYVQVNTSANTENMQVPLVGGPYPTNANATIKTLYYSMVVNKETMDTPNSNGTYFAALNTGVPLATTNVEGLLMIVTNYAQPGDYGDYQIAIGNDNGDTVYSNGLTSPLFNSINVFPQDLVPGSNYTVVVAVNLSNAVSTVWVNPSTQSSPSVTAPKDIFTVANPIADFELRQSGNESGDIAGTIDVSYVKVGTTFDSVFPSLQVTPSGNKVIVNWSDPTLGIQESTNLLTTPFTDIVAQPPYTNNTSTNSIMFYKFGR